MERTRVPEGRQNVRDGPGWRSVSVVPYRITFPSALCCLPERLPVQATSDGKLRDCGAFPYRQPARKCWAIFSVVPPGQNAGKPLWYTISKQLIGNTAVSGIATPQSALRHPPGVGPGKSTQSILTCPSVAK